MLKYATLEACQMEACENYGLAFQIKYLELNNLVTVVSSLLHYIRLFSSVLK